LATILWEGTWCLAYIYTCRQSLFHLPLKNPAYLLTNLSCSVDKNMDGEK
jgi:hypothetical protein